MAEHENDIAVPFGLAVAAREPIPFEDVDLTALAYDPERQIMLVRDERGGDLSPWCKHSTGVTNTNSNTDGHSRPESDTDHTED